MVYLLTYIMVFAAMVCHSKSNSRIHRGPLITRSTFSIRNTLDTSSARRWYGVSLVRSLYDLCSTIAILQWRHDGHDGFSNHQPHDCLLNLLSRRKSKKTSKLRVTGIYAGNSPWIPRTKCQWRGKCSIGWRQHGDGCKHCMQSCYDWPCLTHLPRDKMAAISQTIFSDAFSWMKNCLFWLKFHWSLFLRIYLTTTQHWFRLWLGAE